MNSKSEIENQEFFSARAAKPQAFTLIELLVVIAIIGVLAALLFPALKGLKNTRIKSVARTELTQLDLLIQSYKGKLGFYPPDNPANPLVNQLYYELSGTTSSNNVYTTLDGVSQISAADLVTVTSSGVTGFANSGATAVGSDDKPGPVNYLKDAQLKPGQIAVWPVNLKDWRALVCSVGWAGEPATSPTGNALAPWQYRSSSPTNNPGSFDLWVDVYLDGKTNRISNWSKTPQIVF
jgi:prepilin-type N-terminal cleavage/methylation domain-containing protein